MTERIYTQEKTTKILENKKYKDIKYLIVTYGSHPCCYVEIPENHYLFGKSYYEDEEIDSINCHGGITFASKRDFGFGENYYIGWDYNHYGDYNAFCNIGENHKKWKVKVLEKHCKDVINQIIENEAKFITQEQQEKSLYDDLYSVIEPYIGNTIGINEKGEFDIIQAVKDLLESK